MTRPGRPWAAHRHQQHESLYLTPWRALRPQQPAKAAAALLCASSLRLPRVGCGAAHRGLDGTAAVRFGVNVPKGAPGHGGVRVGMQPLAPSLPALRLREFLQAPGQLAHGPSAPASSAPPAASPATVPRATAPPGAVAATETTSTRTGS